MKITVFFLLAFFIFISSSFAQEDASPPSSSTDTSTEKFTNTGFETDTSSWTTAATLTRDIGIWTTAATLTRDTSIKYRDTASAKIVNSGASALDLTQSVNVGNTNSYFLSAYAFLDPYALGNSFNNAKVDYSTGSSPFSVAIGDLNGDGKADLAVANYNSNTVSILINNGNGTFATKVDYPTGSGPYSVAIGDLNGDGKADLAVTNIGYPTVSILINNGNGTFATKVDYSTGSGPYSVAIGDLNGDGKADLAVANYYSDTVSILINNGNGTFATKVDYPTGKVDYPTGSGPYSVAIGDLNGDGKADLAVTNIGYPTVSILINNGNGTFATKVDYSTGSGPYSVAIGDLNGDGKADLAVANYYSDTVSILINNGNGTFATKVDYPTGKVDYPTGSGPYSVAIGDLNGDGKADLAVTNIGYPTVSILINNGNGTFATKVDYSTGSGPSYSVAIGDLNGDGKADLAVANYYSDTVSIFNSITLSVDANFVELTYNGSVIPTTYAPIAGGWYKLSAIVTGINASTAYGVRVKAGRSIYVDDFSLTDNSPSKKLKECSTSDNNDNIAVNTAGSGLICEMNIKKKILNELVSGTAKNNLVSNVSTTRSSIPTSTTGGSIVGIIAQLKKNREIVRNNAAIVSKKPSPEQIAEPSRSPEQIAEPSRSPEEEEREAKELRELAEMPPTERAVEERRHNAKIKYKKQHDDFVKKLELIVDEDKKSILDDINKNLSQMNISKTNQSMKAVMKMSSILESLEDIFIKTDTGEEDINDIVLKIQNAKDQINMAQNIVLQQAEKEYIISINIENIKASADLAIAKIELDSKDLYRITSEAKQALLIAAEAMQELTSAIENSATEPSATEPSALEPSIVETNIIN